MEIKWFNRIFLKSLMNIHLYYRHLQFEPTCYLHDNTDFMRWDLSLPQA